MKIAVLGSGGREHAIAWKLQQSDQVEKVYCLPGNGGTENNVNIKVNDFQAIRDFAAAKQVDLIIVGPEDPLVNGIVDFFSDSSVKVFGPDKAAAQLEGSKVFAKQFMQKYGVATAEYNHYIINKDENEILDKADEFSGNCVFKYDGLAAGKGVFVCSSMTEVKASLQKLKTSFGLDASIILEEKLSGSELSILAFTDGKDYQLLLPSQDHKQLLEGDKGPNTGGMGAYCPVPFYHNELQAEIEKKIIKPTLKGIQQEGMHYKGVVYFGLMITDQGPQLLEYNVRLGDPETEVVLPALKSDLTELVISCFAGTLAQFKMEFYEDTFIDVVLVSGGYPLNYQKGYKITGLTDLPEDVLVFHAGTKRENNNLITSGGRVINIVVKEKDLEKAIKRVYDECIKIYFQDIYFRKDIGKRKVINK